VKRERLKIHGTGRRAQGGRMESARFGGCEALIDRSLEDEKIRRYDGKCRKWHIKAKGIAQGAE